MPRTPPRPSRLPRDVEKVLRELPSAAGKLVSGNLSLSQVELRSLKLSLVQLSTFMGSEEQSLTVLEALARDRKMAAAVAQLVAFASRHAVDDASTINDESRARVACVGTEVAAAVLACTSAEDPEPTAGALEVAASIVESLLDADALAAYARQAAAAAAALAAPAGAVAGPGPSAPSGPLPIFRSRAAAMASAVLRLLTALAVAARVAEYEALSMQLLVSVRDSHVLDHLGRLLLLLGPAANAAASPQPPATSAAAKAQQAALAEALAPAVRFMFCALDALSDLIPPADEEEPQEWALERPELGPRSAVGSSEGSEDGAAGDASAGGTPEGDACEGQRTEVGGAAQGLVAGRQEATADSDADPAGCQGHGEDEGEDEDEEDEEEEEDDEEEEDEEDAIDSLGSILGPWAHHAVLTLGSAALAAADLGPCGLPASPLPAPPLTEDAIDRAYPCLNAHVVQGWAERLGADQRSAAPAVSRRAAIRLCLRAVQLAGASARAAQNRYTKAARRTLRVQLDWEGGRREASQVYRLVLGSGDGGNLAWEAVRGLAWAAAKCPRAWAAEAGAAWAPLLTGAMHALPELGEEYQPAVLKWLGSLMASTASRLCRAPEHPPELVSSPAQLPPAAAAALDGGLVPLLEALLRAAGDRPHSSAAQLAAHLVADRACRRETLVLVLHSPPRQAAAFIATLTKLVRHAPRTALLQYQELYVPDGDWPRSAWVMAAWELLELGLDTMAGSRAPAEPPGPLDPAAPCAPLFVLALAMLQLLPELVKVASERLLPALTRRVLGAPEPGVGGEPVLAVLLQSLLWALKLAIAGHSSSAAPPHRLAAALSLTRFVRETAMLGLLGSTVTWYSGHADPEPAVLGDLAECCLGLHGAQPQLVWTERKLGEAAEAGGVEGPHTLRSAWQPVALRALASKLRRTQPALGAEVEALAAKLAAGSEAAAEAQGESGAAAAVAVLAVRLAALKAEARTLLPACANPACVNLAGESEAGLKLQQCARCKGVSYCCRECQTAHWQGGHKAVCVAEGG